MCFDLQKLWNLHDWKKTAEAKKLILKDQSINQFQLYPEWGTIRQKQNNEKQNILKQNMI